MLLHVLWGMLFGYLLASVRFASIIVSKGYRSMDEIPDVELDQR
jgi:hypothetical protein